MSPERPSDRWRLKANQDLLAAETLLRASPPPIPYDLVCFHAQQSAEKYLKGWLVSHEGKAPRTHDLENLVRRACLIESRFEALRATSARLTQYAVTPRYPGEVPDPGENEARLAIGWAKEVRDFVESLGPRPDRGLPLG